MGLFSRKSDKATNEPFNPFIGENSSGPIDVTPVSASSEGTTPTEDFTKPAVETEPEGTTDMPATAEEEPAPVVEPTEIPVVDASEPTDDLGQAESPELEDIKKPTEENAVVAAEAATTDTDDMVSVASTATDNIDAEPLEPDDTSQTEDSMSIIDSIGANKPTVTEESLAAATTGLEFQTDSATDEETTEVNDTPEIDTTDVDDTPVDQPESDQVESLIPAGSVVDDGTDDTPAVRPAEEEEDSPEPSEKKSRASGILLIVAALVCIGLAAASALLYIKWQNQQSLTLEKEAQINTLTQQINDSANAGSDAQSLTDENASLKTENQTLTDDKLNLQNTVTTLTEENNNLKTQIEQLQADSQSPGTTN